MCVSQPSGWKFQMNNYIVRSYRDVIVITKFALTKQPVKHRVQSCIKTKNIVKNLNKNNRLTVGQFSKLLQLLIMHTAPQRAMDCGPGLGWLNKIAKAINEVNYSIGLFQDLSKAFDTIVHKILKQFIVSV